MTTSNRRVLITGGASGLGLALAKQYLAAGDRVVVGDLAPEKPATVPAEAAYLTLDVRKQQDWDAARAYVQDEWGGLDVLVNNAGVATGGRIDVESMADWERIIDINLLGVARGCHTMTPVLKAQGSGHIVNVASLAGLVHTPGMASYNATKAAVVALSETIKYELEPFGIDVSVICPAFFRTNLASSFAGKDEAMEAAGKRLINEAKHGADEIAAVAFKAIQRGRFIVLTDTLGRVTTLAKRFAPPLYHRFLRDAAKRLATKPSAEGAQEAAAPILGR